MAGISGDTVASGPLSFNALIRFAGGKDVPCPLCAPTSNNPRKPVLKVWRKTPDFITYACARCGEHGWASDKRSRPVDAREVVRRMQEAQAHHKAETARRREKAQWLWNQAVPAIGSIAERYLHSRGIAETPWPLRCLPARGNHAAAMLAAFAMPGEPSPGAYHVSTPPSAVHITRLDPEGTKLSKIMLGPTEAYPIALAPPNDLGGLAIAEGIETALSIHQATGLGVWAAGAANRLPKLAPHIASLPHLEAVTIFAEDDAAGQAGADKLTQELMLLRPDIEIRMAGAA